MNKERICFMSAVEMAEKVATQEISSLEITETIIERIEKINPIINAYCTTTFDIARDMARKADIKVKNNENIGKINGIPISIKDLMFTKGIRTTMGSKLFEHLIPDVDAVDVARLKNAGGVILGKTNTPEFGYAGVTHNKIFGVTKNPWNLERTSGGSSGGAGAACASGISPLALGSDGGGSIRHPSCFCGIYGIKPSFGRVPIFPNEGILGYSISHHGPMTRFVEDAALMLDVIKGPHEGDQFSLPAENISYSEGIKDIPNKLKIAFSIDLGYAKVLDPDVERVVRDSIEKLEKEFGWDVEESKVKLRPPIMAFNTIYTAIYGYELGPKLTKWREEMDPDLIKLIEAGLSYPSTAFMKAISQRKEFYEKIYRFMKNYDFLITPTTAIPAFGLGMMFPSEINGIGVSPTGWQPFTFPFNLTGQPAATVPCGWSRDDLPIGIQIIGKRFDDLGVLKVSKAFQDIVPWQKKHPNF